MGKWLPEQPRHFTYAEMAANYGDRDRYWGAGWMINFDRYVLPELFGSYHLQFYHRQRGLSNLYDTSKAIWDTWTDLRFPVIPGLGRKHRAEIGIRQRCGTGRR